MEQLSMEKDPNAPQMNAPPLMNAPPPSYNQAAQLPYPTPQQGAPGYGPQQGAPGYGPPGYGPPQPGSEVKPPYGQQPGAPGYAPPPGGYVYPGQPGYAPQYSGQPQYTVHQVGYAGQPGAQQQTVTVITRQRPQSYLGFAIFVCLCCCVPFGVIGIVYSTQSSSKYDMGDYDGAVRASTSAKSWSMAGLVCGVIFITIWIILQVTVFATSSYGNYK
ncbi:uncharacterized protein [Antedon mediterranea]|uniref:uncharacterized protein n=1 Tax=Antedon mediterranea TaxID=105859 RepID=UPI003AF960B4